MVIELIPFDLETFAQEGLIAEDAYRKKAPGPDPHVIHDNGKWLLARLMVWAAYNNKNDNITQYIDFIYQRLFGDKWYEFEVWMDQPINWLDLDLIEIINDECRDFEDKKNDYQDLVQLAYDLIDELCRNRDNLNIEIKEQERLDAYLKQCRSELIVPFELSDDPARLS